MKKKEKNTPSDGGMASVGKKIGHALQSETFPFIVGLLCVIFAIYLLLAFSSFFITGGSDQSILAHPQEGELIQTGNGIQNYAGTRGAQIAQFLINDCFGIPAYFIIVFLTVAGLKLMHAYRFTLWKWFVGCAAVMVWLSVTLAFTCGGTFADSFVYPGGLHGYNVSLWISSQIGAVGQVLVLLVTLILIGIFFTRSTMQVVRKALHPTLPASLRKPDDDDGTPPETAAPQPDDVTPPAPEPQPEEPEEEDTDTPPCEDTDPQTDEEEVLPHNKMMKETAHEPVFEIVTAPLKSEEKDERGSLSTPFNPRLDLEHYHFPTLDLLNQSNDEVPSIDMKEQTANKDRITQVLHSFGVEISSIKASVGPTVTLYEITPAEGIRISKIRNLENDIALSLAALGIRIIAPIPGKGTIGIEVPNIKPCIVPISSILGSRKFLENNSDLPVALGKTITNDIFMVDLAKAPHMLVAGATGQGKSVGLNVIVTSLLYKKHPSELKFVIIDPKRVEFSIYAPIEKHFLAKLPGTDSAIVTDGSKVVQTLKSLCAEMDNRYLLLQKGGCRNIKEYNRKFINRQLNPAEGHHFMPYIVIVIDEFGDLIMTSGKEVELPICRIAQLARAVGIHAIIATQRPTTNIITGTIKANFPARVAFRVASMTDSRTILDRSGAEQLIGKGDMLYLQGSDPVRVQCGFIDTSEVERVVSYICRQQGYPQAYELPECTDDTADGGSAAEVDMNRIDPLFEEAARLLIYQQQGSTSLIQRKFSIGYNRAGRIMDQLERAGIVGPANGSKAREVLCIDENDLQMRMANLK